MGSLQIVFLFDLNVFNDCLSEPRDKLNKRLLDMRLACLRLLTDFSTKTSNLRWGFKFFDSYGSITQIMPKFNFSGVSLEAFESLESEICMRYERHLSYSQALEESSQNNIILTSEAVTYHKREKHNIAPVKILQLALTQILSEFQLEYIDMLSPSSKKVKDNAVYMGKRNFLVLFSNFKESNNMLLSYFGLECLPSRSKLANIILPPALHEQLMVKADVHWVWLNVAEEQKFTEILSSRILHLLSETLQSIQGSLIPLFLLSQSHVKFLDCSEKSLFENEISLSPNFCGSFHNSLLPFSAIFLQSLHRPFYSKGNNLRNKCYIIFSDDNIKIPVQVIKILNEKHGRSPKYCHDEKENHTVSRESRSSDSVTWSKFVIQGAVSGTVKFIADDTLMCLPGNLEVASSIQSLVVLNKILCFKGLKLVLTCITDSGLQMPGLLTPLSNEAAVISILDPLVHLIHRPDFKNFNSHHMQNSNEKLENEVINFKTEQETYCPGSDVVNPETDSTVKQFQMECLEVWFKPTAAFSSLVKCIQSKSKNSNKIQAFHKFLQKSLPKNDIISASSSKQDKPSTSDASVCEIRECEILADNLEDLMSASKNIYNSAVDSSCDVLEGAKKIMKMVANYFKKHCGRSFEDDVQNFMQENFLLTCRRISEKYEMLHTEEDTNKQIKEFQVQVLLLLEIESLTLPPDKTNCVNSVTSLLRMMSFFTGAPQLVKLLCDVLQENYSNLYDVLVEIGDELNIPIVAETESSDSPDNLSSELVDGELFSSVVSSNMSKESFSSSCSQRDNNRKLVRHRSDISDTIRSRQVLLPGTSPKKKKAKSSAQRKSLRCSPRLASRKKDKPVKEGEKPKTVCRNLFPKEKCCRTPRKNRNNQATTPKSKKKNSAKRKFVAETPSYKQNHSALQRRKSFVELESSQGLPKEIAESPKIMKNAKNDANKELLRKLQRRSSEISLKPVEEQKVASTSNSYKQYTPESKRRLSLKLFSKLLASPTARMGIKKCTKRLFDQVSPQKSSENSKKHKPTEESKLASHSADESNSQLQLGKGCNF